MRDCCSHTVCASVLQVLGMFYASEATAMESHNGLAQYRDRIRLAALHRQVGYIPLSFDRDHEVALAELAPDEHGKDTRLHVQVGPMTRPRGVCGGGVTPGGGVQLSWHHMGTARTRDCTCRWGSFDAPGGGAATSGAGCAAELAPDDHGKDT